MAISIKLLPRGAQNLLSGRLQSSVTSTDTYIVGDVVPSPSKLPCYLWIDYGLPNQELVMVYDVSGSNMYIKRGLNNGGIGLAHGVNAAYKEVITMYHINKFADALETGWVLDHTDVYVFTRVSGTEFSIGDVDRTGIYQPGTLVKFNGAATAKVVSSSFSSPNTVVTVDSAVVPATISTVEIYADRLFPKEHNPDGTHGDVTANSVSTDTITEKTANSGVTIEGVLLKDSNIQNPTPFYTATDGATITFDLSVSRNQIVILGGNRTLALSNVSTGMVFIIHLKQDTTGGRTVTWWSGISWADGTAPTLTTTANKTDTFGFICTGTNTYYGYIVGQGL